MKIYRVMYEDGSVRSLWTSYRSAAGSGAQAHAGTRIEVAHVPDDAWKPADPRQESRLSRLQNLWYGLDEGDAQEALRQLELHLQRRRKVHQPAAVLADEERREVDAMLKLDRLVDAQ